MKFSARLVRNFHTSIAAKQQFLADAQQHEVFERAIAALVEAYRNGGRLYIAGNGGSAADAQHLAAEFVVRLGRDRPSLPAEAMTVDTSILTAIGNDYGYDHVFARQVAGKMRSNDFFLGITTSGQSPNILRALEQCRQMGIATIVFTGKGGGAAKALADYCITVPGTETGTIQELHIVLAHTLCECVETALLG